ncbi:protein-L-isoaspartate(D-aspartate) O-methyltransferase [Sinorhizobium meliloti]|uniref:Protein-L-isoaspartate O-methyltransferase n=1 Tax=Rhizobium meliloti TaxID=382 RepID=A0A6A7ZX36_RHIML|nr:protein-L-isoaspartate(D-aspartate) O-methyltransferase [Sinorhizobium meliloti]MDW9376392.1 protein-L-isoaspartate(D-aspartate) O-methyltransferase [Sinorhizobium meliloti]MDW9490571.1 protein-L-isoaspartate(D-aspartate) O-methyltransferase [Sinorhizobium meliloti]MDW9563354.1 protein-L-isoaspartate(D-aspartate) O-methyltransferase [Sinorhizobium meliloti]MDW9650590.1 protein-L-isoaspartate(D-aspartate) O-methyltransferase [Sinorhizobium meliloti]MDW9859720.1 protein-L-isoaspartate(D-aspar
MNGRISQQEGFAAMALRLRSGGIVNHELLKAVEQTPRTLFAPPQYQDEVYSKRLIPLECGSFMEGCDMAVRLLHCLNLKPGQRILEVGTGSGFTAAVMGRIAERVLTIERYQTLVASAQKNLEKAGLRNVVVRQADGSAGVPGEGTFDRILITAAFNSLPRTFSDHLVSGGTLLVPIMMSETHCRIVRVNRTGSRFDREDLFDAPYLPIVPQVASFL